MKKKQDGALKNTWQVFLANGPAKRVGNSSTTLSIFNELYGEIGRKIASFYS